MEKQYKFLAIAPSNGIAHIIEETAALHKNVQTEVYVGSLQRGEEIVQEKMTEGFDAVIARGATAQRIKESCSLPVIEIQISFYDVLQAVKLAENFEEKIVIVGFPAVTENAILLRDLLQSNWEIYTIHEEGEADELLQKLKKQQIRLIVSGMALDDYFKKYGFNFIQITTGNSSVVKAMEEAIQVSSLFRPLRDERQFYQEIIKGGDEKYVILNEQGEMHFSSADAQDEKYMLGYAQRSIKNFREGQVQKVRGKDKYVISQRIMYNEDRKYYVFYYIKTSLPFQGQKKVMNIFTREEAIQKFLQHQNEFAFHWRESEMQIHQISESSNPVILIGEDGVGKEQLAASIYTSSEKRASQYYYIDLQEISERFWNYLMSSENSPLNAKGWTIYFRGINKLTPERITELKKMIIDTQPYTKNKYIFSYTMLKNGVLPAAITSLINDLGCIVLHILPLRERKEEIPLLSSIYVNSFNVEYARQVSGFSKEAMECLKKYNWPGNLAQFKRIMMQLVQSANMPYIQMSTVEKLLMEEGCVISDEKGLDLSKTLDEINYDIVQVVLEQCEGNQTAAAKRLGICRTTLWRMINRK